MSEMSTVLSDFHGIWVIKGVIAMGESASVVSVGENTALV